MTVSSAGVVKGVKKGSATITATNSSGEKAICVVTVVKAPCKVTVTPEKLTLAAGQSCPLTYTISSGSSGAVTWSSKKTSVAQVDPITGVVTAVAAGTTEVVARAFNGKKDSVKLTVIKAPTQLSFPQSAFSIGVGQKFAASVDQDAYNVIEYQIRDPNCGLVVAPGMLVIRPDKPRMFHASTSGKASPSKPCSMIRFPSSSNCMDHRDLEGRFFGGHICLNPV